MRRRDFVIGSTMGGAMAASVPLHILGDGSAIRAAQAAIDDQREVGADVKRHALVIGNGAYKIVSPLDNPPNDARSVASALRELQFNVEYVEDADLNALYRALEAFAARVRAGEVTLIYYAGHGVQVDGVNFLLPIDVDANTVDDMVSRSLSFDTCINATRQADSGMAIFILDACRDNPFDGLEGAIGRGLASVSQAKGETFIAYAAAAGAVAYDDAGGLGNSPFTSALVSALEMPGRDIFEVFREVRGQVREATSGNQLPWLSTSLERSFVFRPNPDEPVPKSINPEAVGKTERVMWDAISQSTDREDFWAFLELYPESDFAAQAELMLGSIEADGLPILPQQVVPRSVGLPAEVTTCDQLAADPYDSQRITEGVVNALVNTRLAIRECTKALANDEGNPRLEFQLARVLNIREQWDDAEAYLVKASEKNYAAAFSGRADLYVKGVARPKDYDFAFSLFQKASTLGDVGGQLGLARAYLEGWGTNPSVDNALRWYQEAAAREFAPALDSLGTLYSRGHHVEPDLSKAAEYYRKAAALGSSNAMNSLARLYLAGRGVNKDPMKAIELFGDAIARGNIFAPYHLAKMYRTGWSVESDIERAIELYRLSAERGFAGGWIELARIHQKGEGIPADPDSAYFYAFIAKEIALQRSAKDPVYQQAQEEIELISASLSLDEQFEIDRRAERWLTLNGPNLRRTRNAFK